MNACVLTSFSGVRLFVALWTVAYQAPLSMGFSGQEYCSGLPCSPPGDLPEPGIELASLHLRHWQVDSLPPVPAGKHCKIYDRIGTHRKHRLMIIRKMHSWAFFPLPQKLQLPLWNQSSRMKTADATEASLVNKNNKWLSSNMKQIHRYIHINILAKQKCIYKQNDYVHIN